MDNKAFQAAYTESRNGANGFYRHSLVRYFVYSDGVKECAEAGCYWLLDVIGTEIAPRIRQGINGDHGGWVVVTVKNSKAKIALEIEEGKPVFTKNISHTDMSDGKYEFEIGFDGAVVALSLITEH